MKFSFVTLFESLIKFYFEDSILKRAMDKELIQIDFHNPREYTKDKHLNVDDYIYGGGAGLLMMNQPLFDLLKKIKKQDENAYIIFPLASAKPFHQKDARRLAKKDHIVFVSGRYEGIDERVIEEFADEVFSIGDYILTGGELPSLVMSDAISRNIDDVLGNKESLDVESYEDHLLEAPSFTKPSEYDGKSIPKPLLSGHHKKIEEYREELSKCKTKYYRPDMYQKAKLKK
jgi:tRNA (guanine37-N1)-methyltransferase